LQAIGTSTGTIPVWLLCNGEALGKCSDMVFDLWSQLFVSISIAQTCCSLIFMPRPTITRFTVPLS
jgi:hypothetical protein